MKRKTAAMILAAVLASAAALGGCVGSGNSAKTGQETETAAEPAAPEETQTAPATPEQAPAAETQTEPASPDQVPGADAVDPSSAGPAAEAEANGTEETADPEMANGPGGTEEQDQTFAPGSDNGILVVYFSRTGEQYGVGVIEKGNTEILAEMIAEDTGADLYEITPAQDDYPTTYDALTDVAKKEQSENARPAYKDNVPDLKYYSTIFIGAPVWWEDWPMIMYTFFENEDLSGKILIPFCTYGGSGMSGLDGKLAETCTDSMVVEGLAVLGEDAQNNPEDVRSEMRHWLSELGY